MAKGINVLSLFDGISCGQQALKELGVKVNRYYASEIDFPAMQITFKNHPDTKFIGSVTDVKAKYLPKIDLLLAGSPCQGFSFNGKRLNFEDPRSKLFFEFVRILKECQKINPKVKFLLENVRMKKEWADVISKNVGVSPVLINSKLLSAQSRNRLYWANWKIEQPKDLGICIDDILETPAYKGKVTSLLKTDRPSMKRNFNKALSLLDTTKKHPCLLATSIPEYHHPGIATSFKTHRPISIIEAERLQTLPDDYTKGLTYYQRLHGIGNGWTVAVIKHILKN